MDKKIKDIAEKAGFVLFTPEEDPDTPIDWASNYDVELQEFAKLIIAECFDVVHADGRFHDCRNIIKSAKYVVLEHFGVDR